MQSATFIKRVCERYVKYINRKRKRVTFFQSPYIPKLVDNRSLPLSVSRYVHLNPVSGGAGEIAKMAIQQLSSI